jgi:large subunit ribosomal protein L7Ae
MAKAYVNFTVSAEVAAKTYEALQLAKQSGAVKKGANEVTKSVERGLATFVVLAEDVEPEEVVVHIPKLCEQKKIAYSYVPKKIDLGKAIGMNVPCAAVAVETQGTAANAIKDIVSKITGISKKEVKVETPAAQHAAPAEKKPKKEKAQAQQAPTA